MTFVYPLDHDHARPRDAVAALVGGKAANLGVMARVIGLPVPPGFVITTEACREFLARGWPDGLDDEIRAGMATLEAVTGRRFGDAADPLLVSVRSGAPVSMPGMMDTILDLGLTDASCDGLAAATGDATFARDCLRRFRAMFRETVGVADVPEDPWTQLRLAVEAVFRSWNGERARAYRRREGIPDDLGTAVTVQAMVFGNRGDGSATGVLFTRNPATGERSAYGDVLFGAQGEDVVAGTHRTEPLDVLDSRLPDVARDLRAYAERLERYYADLCDIEFTIERGRLWMLQVRVGKRTPEAAVRMAVEMAEDPTFPLSRADSVRRVAGLLADPPARASGRGSVGAPLVIGLPASPGIASGEIATTPERAERVAAAGRGAILVRAETSPDDVHGMAKAVGVLTARGGMASHAAVVARGWGIPAVVGATELAVFDGRIEVAGRSLHDGDTITIDGSSGEVFEGSISRSTEVVPEALTLLAWAAELGIEIGGRELADGATAASAADGVAAGDDRRAPGDPRPAEPPRGKTAAGDTGAPDATLDACLETVGTKGFATVTNVADALFVETGEAERLLERLAADGLVSTVAGAHRLTDAGRERADALLSADRDAWGASAAGAALDAFVTLDRRMKETVTAWQLRPAADGTVPNDHTDAAYDARVLADLAALHADADAWLSGIEAACPRLLRYRLRLARAAARAGAGDAKFVASPRVDSYHGIWFELHEDLIRLAGRTREDEVAAGRA